MNATASNSINGASSAIQPLKPATPQPALPFDALLQPAERLPPCYALEESECHAASNSKTSVDAAAQTEASDAGESPPADNQNVAEAE
ncbi:MAG TPA: hypothetical protein VFV87_23080, partial [Pirellulaceae bacterium]|nr:hypothetical protein [Pirellulaceae bacterium]